MEPHGMLDTPSSYQDKAVLVTGASGFIGAQLCQQLLAQGACVHALSRSEHASDAIQWHQCELAN